MPSALVARFADETDVFGLHLFNIPRSKFEVIFWCSFVLIFSCYTTKTLVRIVEQYVDEEVVSHVYQIRDPNISFPFTELCVRGAELVVQPLPIENAIQLILSGFERNLTELNGSAFVSVMEFLFKLQTLETRLRLSDSDSEAGLKTDDEGVATGLIAFAKYSKMTLARLAEMLLLEFCKSLQIEVSFTVNKKANTTTQTVVEVCKSGHPATLLYAPFSFCIDIRGEKFVYQTGTEQLRVSVNNSLVRGKLGIVQSVGIELWLTGLLSQELEHVDFESTIFLVPGTSLVHEVRISALNELLDLRRRRCSEDDEKRVWCKSSCESAFFYAAYGCWPLIYSYQFSSRRHNASTDVRLCTVDDYLNSTRYASPDDLQRGLDCITGCFVPCKQQTYLLTSTDFSMLSPADPHVATARVYVQSFAHPVVEERLANDFESFLSNFGGSLGLFFGASFASVIHIPLYWLQALVGFWFRNQKQSEVKAADNVEIEVVDRDAIWNDRFRVMNDRLERVENMLMGMEKAMQHYPE